jgi:glycosyltransferase involved in cell wall biosynthesis
MRTLLVVPWDQTGGGVASVVGNLAHYIQNQGHTVLFFYPGRGKTLSLKKKTTRRGFHGFELRLGLPLRAAYPMLSTIAFLLLLPITLGQLIYLIYRYKIQIVNIHYPVDYFFYFALCRGLLPIKLVTSVHGADLLPGGKPRVKYSYALKLLLRASDRIVAPSRSYQEEVVSLFPALQEKIMHIHNGLDMAELMGPTWEEGREERQRYILCIAAHNEKKGIDVLLHAAKRLQQAGAAVKIVLVGDGPLRRRLEDLAVSLGVQEQVDFLGSQGRTQVAALLHGCEVFVLPSRHEPFGVVLLEALACQKPVVATAVGGIQEIIENGQNGILVPPDNAEALAGALLAVLQDQALQRALGSQGYRTVHERFRFESNGATYIAVFRHLIGSATTNRPQEPGAASQIAGAERG